MKKFLLSTLFFLNIGYICFAQTGNRQNKIEVIHVAYMTKELSLTTEEAEKFWPVYRLYREELVNVRKVSTGDEVVLDENILNIRKKYKQEFKKVLGANDRVNKVFLAEKSFRELLRNELIKRRASRFNKN